MKKFLAIALCLMLVVGFVACGPKAGPLKDGDYTYEAAEFSHGYKDTATMKVENGYITALTWDCIQEGTGELKSVLSENGGYVMTESGPTWAAQSKALCDYVIKEQSTEGLTTNDEGKTDVVTSVSITITGFTTAVNDMMQQAAK